LGGRLVVWQARPRGFFEACADHLFIHRMVEVIHSSGDIPARWPRRLRCLRFLGVAHFSPCRASESQLGSTPPITSLRLDPDL